MAAPVSREVLRAGARALLDEHSPGDALAAYYVLHHPADRAELFTHSAPGDSAPVDGFLVRARTGLDLFRPLVTFRAGSEDAARELFAAGLQPGRPAYLTLPMALAGWANKYLSMADAELHRIFRLDPARYVPEVNVLVITSAGADGSPRCEIRSGGQAAAIAGVNWQSPAFAEIFVYTESAVRGRGWGRSVVTALAGQILQSGRTPLYVVAESNAASIHLAETAGFSDTGLREYVGQAVRVE